MVVALPWWLSGKESACQCRRCRFDPWIGRIPWRRKRQPTPGFLPGKSHGQRSLSGHSPWGPKRVRHHLAIKQQQRILVGGFLARVSVWWCSLGTGEEDALEPGAAGLSCHGGHMLLCWDRGLRSRSLPSAGLLGRRRKLLRTGGQCCVQAWTLAASVGPRALQCVACPALCWVIFSDAG